MTERVFLMGGVGNILFQFAYALSLKHSPEVVLIDTRPRGWLLKRIYPLVLHADWLGVEDVANKIGLEIRSPSIFEWILLFFCYLLRRVNRQDYSFAIFGKCYHLGYFQDVEYTSDVFGRVSEAITGALHAESFFADVNGQNSLTVHARGFDFSSDARLSAESIAKVAKKFRYVNIIGNDSEFEREISMVCEARNLSSDAISDFLALASSKHLMCADSTFCFWAALTKVPGKKVVYTKEHSVFSRYSNQFLQVEAISE